MRRLALLALALLLAWPATAQLSLLGLQNQMVQFLLAQISTEGVFVVTADTVTEPETGVTAIEGLSVVDADGVWLTARRVAFAWNASRLLSGEIEFSRLSLEGVTVRRAPGTRVAAAGQVAAADPEPFAWPRSPLTLRVAALTLTDIALDAAVLGHAISFDATGALRDEGDIQAMTLALRRDDAVAGTIDLDYARDFAANTLALTLAADEAPQGLVAALADLAPDVPVWARVTADGPPRDWRAQIDVAAERVIALTGTAALAYEGPFRVDADLALTPGPLLGDPLRAVLGTGARLEVRADEDAAGLIAIDAARLTAPDLDLAARGTYARPTGVADLGVDLAARPGLAQLVPGVGFGGATFRGTVRGGPQDLAARGDATLTGLATAPLDAVALSLAVEVTQTGPRLSFSATGTGTGLRLDRLTPDLLGTVDLDVAGDLTGTRLTLTRARFDSLPLRLVADGQLDTGGGQAVLGVTLAAPDLAPLAAAYGVAARGGLDGGVQVTQAGGQAVAQGQVRLTGFAHPAADLADLTLTGRVTQADDIGFALEGTARGLRLDRLGPDLLAAPGGVRLHARGRLAGAVLQLDAAGLDAAPLRADLAGTADLGGGPLALRYTLTAPDIAPLAAAYDLAATGGGVAEGTLAGTLDTPSLDGQVRATGLGYDGTAYGAVDLAHDITLGAVPQGRVDVTADGSPYGPVAAAGRFDLEAPRLRLQDLDLAALGLRGRGAATLDLDTQLATGDLRLGGGLAGLRRLTGLDLAGRLDADLALTTAQGRQNATLAARVADLGAAGVGATALSLTATGTDLRGRAALDLGAEAEGIAAPGATLDAARATARLTDALGTTPRVDATVEAGPGTLGPAALDRLALTARGPTTALDLTLTALGREGGAPLTADLAARLGLAGGTLRATVSRADLAARGEALRLAAPLEITSRGGTAALRGLDLRLDGGGGLTGALASHGNGIGGDLTLTALPARLGALAGVPVRAGVLDGRAVFDTRPRGAGATVRLTARDLAFDETFADGALGGALDLDWDGTRATAALTVTGDFGDPIRGRLGLDARPSGGPLPTLGPGLDGALTWAGRIERFWALVPAPAHVLAGDLDVALTLGGTLDAPRPAGRLRLDGGRYENLDTGTLLTDLTARTTLRPDGGVGLTLTGADGGAGRLALDATLPPGLASVTADLTLTRAILVRLDAATARLSGALSVAGPLAAPAIQGGLTIDEAEVRLVTSGAPGVIDLGPIRFKGDPPPAPPAADTGGPRLDLTVTAPGRIFVRGRGLDSEWQANLAVQGPAAAPRLTGRIERRRGRLDLIGRAFELTRGEVIFDGGPTLDPRLAVTLAHERPEITGRIEVTGTASAPVLAFTSSPAVPAEEVMPRTLFGKVSQALTASEAASLALGLATLMDGKGGTLDRVRGAVGLDTLRLEQDSGGTPAIAVAKEVAPGVTVGAKQSVGGEASSVTVEVEVFDNITVDAEAGSDASSSVGVNWRLDF